MHHSSKHSLVRRVLGAAAMLALTAGSVAGIASTADAAGKKPATSITLDTRYVAATEIVVASVPVPIKDARMATCTLDDVVVDCTAATSFNATTTQYKPLFYGLAPGTHSFGITVSTSNDKKGSSHGASTLSATTMFSISLADPQSTCGQIPGSTYASSTSGWTCDYELLNSQQSDGTAASYYELVQTACAIHPTQAFSAGADADHVHVQDGCAA